MAAVIGWDTKGQPGAKGSIFVGEEMEQKIMLSLAQVCSGMLRLYNLLKTQTPLLVSLDVFVESLVYSFNRSHVHQA